MRSYLIHFIRHGLTEANKQGRYAGFTDYPVCEEGISELLKLKNDFDYPYADVIFSSPLIRCTQTANILYDSPKIIAVDGLKEINFGDWEDKSAKELENDGQFKAWISDGGKGRVPNGESTEMFAQRVGAAFETIVEGLMKSKTFDAVICAHGGTIMSILSAYGLPKAGFYDWVCANGCGYSVRINMNMWLNSKLFEIYERVPKGNSPTMGDDQQRMFEMARDINEALE